MADNKSRVKKPVKSVLDYDPLAWLSEGDDDTESLDTVKTASENKKAVVKKAGVKKSIPEKKSAIKNSARKSALNKRAVKKSSKKTVAKKLANKKATATKIEATEMSGAMSDSSEHSPGYGFFDETPGPVENETTKIAAESDLDAGQAYGFFSGNDGKTTSESESEQGYGLFESSEQLTTQSIQLDSSTNVINLGAELTIRSVSACKTLIDELISNGFDVKLAAGDLQKIDTAGLQLLYSLNNTLEKTSQSINWVSSNSIINDAAQLIGIPKLLESSDDEAAYGFFNEENKSDSSANEPQGSAFGFF